jgi:hypothetical protein
MTPSKFIGTLFQSRDIMHLQHLKTMSFAEHKALNAYYDGILDLTDTFTETFFGENGRVEIEIPSSLATDAINYLKSLKQIVRAERENYTSELQNILDEVLGLINKTLYLLTLT